MMILTILILTHEIEHPGLQSVPTDAKPNACGVGSLVRNAHAAYPSYPGY